jgi:Na+/H+ antiporter NhaD/arsenite permease-like protein
MTSIIFGLLAMSSTLAGNLTMLGSVANLIV